MTQPPNGPWQGQPPREPYGAGQPGHGEDNPDWNTQPMRGRFPGDRSQAPQGPQGGHGGPQGAAPGATHGMPSQHGSMGPAQAGASGPAASSPGPWAPSSGGPAAPGTPPPPPQGSSIETRSSRRRNRSGISDTGSYTFGATRRDRRERRRLRREQPKTPGQAVLAAVREFAIIIVLAMTLSFIVKTWFMQAFFIPSGSMEDTLIKDDRVLVNKLVPGPFSLSRGDIIVFEDPGNWLATQDHAGSGGSGPIHSTLVFVGLLPDDSQNHLIKRVIGLPGDTVEADGTTGSLKVNGVPIDEPYIKPGDAPSPGMSFKIKVPKDKVWVMGDHRSSSSDSRYHDNNSGGQQGSVPIDKVVGKAAILVWPIDRFTFLENHNEVFADVPDAGEQ